MRDKKILIVDDDPSLLQMLERVFAREGAQVHTALEGRQALRQFHERRPDLVILDIMMPGMDGWEVCRHIRQLSDAPIVMLTTQDRDDDIARGLDAGADDYVTKPFSVKVLVARTRAALRRAALPPVAERRAPYQDDHLTIDLDARRVQVRGEPARLTAKEFKLLSCLLDNAGRVVTFQQILEHVWGWEYGDSVNYVHVYVSHLRQKIEPDAKDPSYIATEHGVGYRFEKHIA
jgi:DNA-binding response OmpR family regulator